MPTPNLMDAIRVAKENEKIAMERYADAAKNLTNPLGKELFEKLSQFESFHYKKLTILEKSLHESDMYIVYEGMEFPLPPVFRIKAAEEPDKKSAMQIITEAMDLEREAQAAYASLAAECPDQQGQEMFTRLSNEEHTHFLILSEAYWSLNDTGTWKWSRP